MFFLGMEGFLYRVFPLFLSYIIKLSVSLSGATDKVYE